MSKLLCMIKLHDWELLFTSLTEDARHFLATGSIPKTPAVCRRCLKKREF